MASFRQDKIIVLKALGRPLDDNLDFACLRDDIVCRVAHGLEYPKVLLPHKNMIELNAAKTLHTVYTGGFTEDGLVKKDVPKLAIGRLVHTILTNMEEFIVKISKQKLHLFAAHDTTLAPMMEVLDIWDDEWPPFGATIIFELYQKEGAEQFFVKVLYNGECKKIRNQKNLLVPFFDFKQAVKPYRLPHYLYTQVCNVQNFL